MSIASELESAFALWSRVEPAVQQWLQWDPNSQTRAEVQQMLDDALKKGKDKMTPALTLLASRLLNRVQFGTAGLRALMAAGYSCLNDLVIIQATQGLAKYILSHYSAAEAKHRGLVVGYDARHNSRKWAELTAAIAMDMGIGVHLFSRLTCTPMVPFAVLELHALAGVMITASHNPKDDNGYKVYWTNGAQIIPPHDTGIAAYIEANLKPSKNYVFDPAHPLHRDPTVHCTAKYMSEIERRYCYEKKANLESKTKVIFTPMHGVGDYWTGLAFKAFGLPPYIPTREQIDPDPEFPTVKFPNPEEGKGALALSIKTAEASGSNLILANDPDADRLAVAERDPTTGQWTIFNGNQIAALFADWIWLNYVKRHPNDRGQPFMLASTVSSKFLAAMARKEGFEFHDTLTGFKWMGNVAADLINKGHTFLFAYEVEIGFLHGDLSLDKDGVRMAAIFAEMANQVYLRGTTLVKHLQALYEKYGFFEMNTSYFFCYSREGFQRIFDRLRTLNNGSYVTSCGPFKITSVRDVTRGLDTGRPDGKSVLPKDPNSQMLTFYFENGAVATMRNSGTEPKLKYYVEFAAPTQEQARRTVDEMTHALIDKFIQPQINQLAPKKAD